jgi:hypothetical protein
MSPTEKEIELLKDTYHQVERRFGYDEDVMTELAVTLDMMTSVFYEARVESMKSQDDY